MLPDYSADERNHVRLKLGPNAGCGIATEGGPGSSKRLPRSILSIRRPRHTDKTASERAGDPGVGERVAPDAAIRVSVTRSPHRTQQSLTKPRHDARRL